MTQEDWPEQPYKLLIRRLAELYPDEVAAELRELGYDVGEPAIKPVVKKTPLDPEETEEVLDLTLELLRQSQAPSVDVEIPGEIWIGEGTDPVLGAYAGQQALVNVHTRDKCAGRHCVLHNPSDHHMREWRLLWRADRRIMERLCPHGMGHPDPDDMAYQRTIGGDSGVHGCDGCCRPA